MKGKKFPAGMLARSLVLALLLVLPFAGARAAEPAPVRYLAFQIFTGAAAADQIQSNIPVVPGDLRKTVQGLRDRIGLTGAQERRLGFVVGPLSFDNTDEEIRRLVGAAFDVALETGVAAGFHIDDSMFWGRLKELDTPATLEWLDWNGTPNTGRRLDWSATPAKIKPQLCVNSPAVRDAVTKRAALIGAEIAKGIRKLNAAGKPDLYLGVIAGWETQIGRDYATGRYLGYCALTNEGFSADKPPPDIDAARGRIVKDFAGFWAKALVTAGAPSGKVYSHIAFLSEAMFRLSRHADPARLPADYLLATNLTPPDTAFCTGCAPGFSTYPQPGHLEQLFDALQKQDNPPWASAEGTAADPSVIARGGKTGGMETYLGNLFGHGARLVNIYGWDVGPEDNPFRRLAEGDDALAAFRKFLTGGTLAQAPLPIPQIPSDDLPGKVHQIQDKLPAWIQAHGPAKAKPLMEELDGEIKKQQFDQAEKTADQILKLIAE